MLELIQLGNKTYYIKNPVNVGIYLLDSENVCLIDTGNSKTFGKEIAKILDNNNWKLKYIINTHSHADHIGGNKYLQEKYNCKIYANIIESYFINTPLLEPSLLYTAKPPKEMLAPFLKADESRCEGIENIDIDGLEIINLEGHSVGLIGIVTSDNICFVGDAYTSEEILNKYKIQYVYDIEKYLNTLNYLKTTKYSLYVPSHGEVESDCIKTIDKNIETINEIEKEILEIIDDDITFNELLKEIFSRNHIKLNIIQYHLIRATIKAYLTKLLKENKIEITFLNNEISIKKVI